MFKAIDDKEKQRWVPSKDEKAWELQSKVAAISEGNKLIVCRIKEYNKLIVAPSSVIGQSRKRWRVGIEASSSALMMLAAMPELEDG
jgi:hypothetical protein